MRRRAFLTMTTVSLAALAGCFGSDDDADDDGVPDEEDDYPEDPERSRRIDTIADTVTVGDGEFFPQEVTLEEDGGVTVDFTVEEGPEIDIIVLPEDQYERFRSGQTWRAKPGTVVGRSGGGTEQVSLPPGTYFVLVDNSSQGVAYASPTRKDNPATVSFETETWASPPSDEE